MTLIGFNELIVNDKVLDILKRKAMNYVLPLCFMKTRKHSQIRQIKSQQINVEFYSLSLILSVDIYLFVNTMKIDSVKEEIITKNTVENIVHFLS